MAVVLYRKGNTHKVDGIECEAGRFDPKAVPALLNQGWHLDPKEVNFFPRLPTMAPKEPSEQTDKKGLLDKIKGFFSS